MQRTEHLVTIVDHPASATQRTGVPCAPTDRTDGSGPARWRTLREQARPWQPLDLPTTIVVPHPDDEALLFGGLIARLCRRNVPIDVIAVTDGEAAYEYDAGRVLAATRRREQRASLDILGLDPIPVRRLELPDGHVHEHVAELTAAIVECGNPVVVAPWQHDHHCDHEACGRAARLAAAALGGEVFGGMFWAWHRTDPATLGDDELVALDLGETGWRRRRHALGQHRSQLEHVGGPPVLTEDLLEPAQWRREYYVIDHGIDADGSSGPGPAA